MKDKDTIDARKPNIGENFDELKMFEGLEVDEEAGRAAIAEAHRLHKRRKMVKAAFFAVCLLLLAIVVAWFVLQPRPPQTLDRDLVTSCVAYDEDNKFHDDVLPGSTGFRTIEYMSDKEASIAYFKDFYDEMLVPGYIPNEYAFQNINLRLYSISMFVGYIYLNNEGEELFIHQLVDDHGMDSSSVQLF